MTLWPVDQLLAERPCEAPVAFSDGALRPFGQFRHDVGACAARLRRTEGRRAVLVTRDAYWGSVGLLALAGSGKEIILPPNALPQTLAAIAEHDDILVGDDALEAALRDACLIAQDKQPRDACLIAQDKQPRDACLIAQDKQPRDARLIARDEQPRDACLIARDEQPRDACLIAQDKQLRAIRLCAGEAPSEGGSPKIDPETPVIFFTSGSTGEPKRIEKTFLQLENEARSIETLLGHTLGPDALVLGTVSHQHAYGLAFRLMWPLLSGRILHGPMVSLWEDVLAVMPNGAALVTSPAHLSRVTGLEPVNPVQRPALILSAGAPLSESAAQKARTFLTTSITEIFGSTETGALAWRSRDGQDAPWSPLPNVTITQGEDGLLHALGRHVPDEPGRSGQTLSDQIEMAGDGTFRLKGRKDRIAKIEGVRVSLDELERGLIALPEIEQAVALVLPGETAQLAAAVIPSKTGARHLSAVGTFRFGRYLRSALADRLPPAALPKRWRFVETLPENAMGKRTVQEMVQLFQCPTSAPHTDAPKVDPEILALRRSEDGCEIDCVVPPDLYYFNGHFAAMPILPGVVQIDWVVRMANQYLNLGLEAACAFQVKFRRIIGQNQAFTLRLRVLPTQRLAFEYRIDGEAASSGAITLPRDSVEKASP